MENYWLIKSEPTSYSIDDLKRDKNTAWTGIRNYQVRNMLRDNFKKGDLCLFYHSSCDEIGIAGVGKVTSSGYPDPTQFDKKDHHYDSKKSSLPPLKGGESTNEIFAYKNLWYCMDVSFVKKFKNILTLAEIKLDPSLDGMLVTKTGSRLSIQPVLWKHFYYISSL